MTFKVKDIAYPNGRTVYAVRINGEGREEFLFYDGWDEKWRWLEADLFKPYREDEQL